MKIKKLLKIIAGVVIFLTLPSLLFFGFVYFKYNEDLPTGIEGKQADALATKMLDALDYVAYKKTNYIEWTFKRKHHYQWLKTEGICYVFWETYKVELDLNNPSESKAYIHGFRVHDEQETNLIEKATTFFNNDSFWLVAPYKVFDKGTKRFIVSTKKGEQGLLVTYTSGGTTPGDSYLWFLDDSGKPNRFKMWADILPIGGLEASWENWTTTESGAQLPTFHKLLFLGLEMGDVKGTK
ncbi:hypothetical protein [Formosa maritima]|uniref:Uncharacterized protein n=1 Tax=Formosa maritima TaxID=2592046 RepID=A0A5D0GIH2_9FLAO|nr:hypothetical protein [Formosa maritima]TYA57342.1 hypothetical protein FVF61_05405 [Formosa maritima]